MQNRNDDQKPLLKGILGAAAKIHAHLERACAPFGITAAQYNVLRILNGGPAEGYPRREILKRMMEQSPDCTRLIDRLEKLGLVRRERTQTDRRLSLTRITPAGLELLRRMRDPILKAEEQLTRSIPERERSHFLRLMQQFLDS